MTAEQDAWEALERADKAVKVATEVHHEAQAALRRALTRQKRARSDWQAAAIRKGETK